MAHCRLRGEFQRGQTSLPKRSLLFPGSINETLCHPTGETGRAWKVPGISLKNKSAEQLYHHGWRMERQCSGCSLASPLRSEWSRSQRRLLAAKAASLASRLPISEQYGNGLRSWNRI